MWKEDAEAQSVESADPGFETVPAHALVIPPTAKRGLMILAAFFLLQIVFAVIAGIALSVIFAVSGGNVSDSETLAANLEDNALLVNMTGTYVASIILVFWLWLKAIDPEDGISFEFLGLRQFTLVSLAKPAATGSGLGCAFLLLGGLLCEAPEGPEFGPLTTLFTASGWGLVLWAVTARHIVLPQLFARLNIEDAQNFFCRRPDHHQTRRSNHRATHTRHAPFEIGNDGGSHIPNSAKWHIPENRCGLQI